MIANLTYFVKLLKTCPINSNLNKVKELTKHDLRNYKDLQIIKHLYRVNLIK
ncbi:MAG: hypothetical protein JWQ54_5091 [Mucilaginibacter sp.]|nr:hypothetical protein [Mucilaginibacter sp.]